ncbi:D,D-heptose 1,7-bisphosphate phosphatase [Raoultella terrigena]|uniref:D,D-heptose 1,7-bisphosphate phosphatase n=1 Tax=Raoultella terrigena TaxID=577 RepID=A0A4U9D9H0_RAOTE|nr:D,D-heptose 1,7-bisphosphate phosphatase [Raoultella terrigena]
MVGDKVEDMQAALAADIGTKVLVRPASRSRLMRKVPLTGCLIASQTCPQPSKSSKNKRYV